MLTALLLSGCANKPDALDIIIKTNEKYKNMQDFKAVKIVKEGGFMITSIKEIEIKGDKYKIVEDDEIEVCDGKNVWNYNLYGPRTLQLIFPENNSKWGLNNPYFIWDEEKGNKYVFQIDETKSFSSLSLPKLVEGKKYYWRVYPIDVNGRFNKSTAEIREFKVKSDAEYEFEPLDGLLKMFITYDGKKSKGYTAFPLGENITDDPMIKAYNSITVNMVNSFLSASLTKKDGKYVIDKDRLNEDLELEIKDDFLLQEVKNIKTDKNKIIIDESVNRFKVYVDEVQQIDKILDIYARDFKVRKDDNKYYIIEGKEAKERLGYDIPWSKIRVWVNKEDYSVRELEFYDNIGIGGGEVLVTTTIYEDVSFNNNFSDENFRLEVE